MPLDGSLERVRDGVIAEHTQRESLPRRQDVGGPFGELREVVQERRFELRPRHALCCDRTVPRERKYRDSDAYARAAAARRCRCRGSFIRGCERDDSFHWLRTPQVDAKW